MAFAGVNDLALIQEATANAAGGRNLCVGITLTLAATAGAFNVANADSGRLVTAVAVANETQIPANFGPGRGNWVANDLLRVTVVPPAPTGATAIVKNIAKTIVAGNLVVDFHSEGAGAAVTNLQLRLIYGHSAVM
jgi:hypothetical protein